MQRSVASLNSRSPVSISATRSAAIVPSRSLRCSRIAVRIAFTCGSPFQRTAGRRCLLQRLAPLQAKKQAEAQEDVDLEMVALEAEEDAEERMKKAIAVVADNFNTMRTGRANPAILDRIQVEYYGVPTPLKSLASVSVPDASTLIISPFDKGGLKDIEKAINESDIGINPSNDGQMIRLNIPPMTQDRRKDLSKKVSKMGEDGKISVRNVRKDAIKKLDKYDFPKDTKKGLEDSIQKLTDSYVKKLDDMVTAKTDDIMKV
eukprot:jgi/Chrzof1/10231/Cz04g33140.t1